MKCRKVGGHALEGFVIHQIDRLDFKRLHEALGLGIVIGIATSAHGADETMFGQQVAIGLGGVLRTALPRTPRDEPVSSGPLVRAAVLDPHWRAITNIVRHAGRLFALEEGHRPFALDPQTLEAQGSARSALDPQTLEAQGSARSAHHSPD
jgi:Retinal pigment epithelial membrane protein